MAHKLCMLNSVLGKLESCLVSQSCCLTKRRACLDPASYSRESSMDSQFQVCCRAKWRVSFEDGWHECPCTAGLAWIQLTTLRRVVERHSLRLSAELGLQAKDGGMAILPYSGVVSKTEKPESHLVAQMSNGEGKVGGACSSMSCQKGR